MAIQLEMRWCVSLLLVSLASSLPLKKWNHQVEDDEKCNFCLATVSVIQNAFESNKTLDDVYPLVERLCVSATGNNTGAQYTCPGLIHSYGPVFQYVATHVLLDTRTVCEAIHMCNRTPNMNSVEKSSDKLPLQQLDKMIQNYKYHLFQEQAHSAPQVSNTHNKQEAGKGSPSRLEKVLDSLRRTASNSTDYKQPIKPHSGQITFLQLSDIHLDTDYDEGSHSDCGLYMCCRHWYNGTGSAGHYGEYQCDLPQPTLDLLLETIQQLDPQPDFIVYTGDNPPHDVWNETWSSQLQATEYLVHYMAQKFPKITIYPAIGNHESWPESEYLGTLPEYKVLTGHLAEYWQQWTSFTPDALNTIAEGGYYSVKIMEGLKLISFNSNYGYMPNLYSFLNPTNDLYTKQWEWITKELSTAERNNEKVLVIAHIPPGDGDNQPEYGEFYLNITKRFSQTIIGHLFGHTHKDHFQLVMDDNGVYGVVLIAPSVTPRPFINPSFRIFTMNASTFELTDYQQYHLNLTKANEMYARRSEAPPVFQRAYSPLEDYGLKDITPQSWEALAKRLTQEPDLLNQYNYNIHARSRESDLVCDSSCKRQLICFASNIISSKYHECIQKLA